MLETADWKFQVAHLKKLVKCYPRDSYLTPKEQPARCAREIGKDLYGG